MQQDTHRDTISVENSIVLDHQHFDDDQHIIRLQAPACAKDAVEGQFVHIQCDRALPLRRPLSIMRTHATEGWIDLLYKAVGDGTALLAKQDIGTTLSLLGPIGVPFTLHEEKPIRLLIGGGVGIPPMIFLAETIAQRHRQDKESTYVLMGSESPFPFQQQASAHPIPGIDKATQSSIIDIEKLGIASRLASLNHFPGCHTGYVTELAEQILQTLTPTELVRVEMFSCGPHPMLAAVKSLAEKYRVACQVSLEEFMACAVGGCAGCVVEIQTENGPAMKRVCVDGPVFEAATVVF